MATLHPNSRADEVRRFVLERFVEPSRAAGQQTVIVRAGDVQKALGWWNRVPSVCSALDGKEFQRMSRTRLVERRGPVQSTTSEWVFALSEGNEAPETHDLSKSSHGPDTRRLIAEWDGGAFRPCIAPENLEAGQQVVLLVSPVQDARDLAGEFGDFVGTLSSAEAAQMQEAIDGAFETISDE